MGLLDWLRRRIHGVSASMMGSEARRTPWPPKELEQRKRLLNGYRRRYHNDEGALVQFNDHWKNEARRKTYTPVPLARELCRYSSSLLFAEQPRITYSENKDLLERVIEAQQGLYGFLQESGETVACEGRGALRIVRDDRVSDGLPIISYVPEDRVLWNVIHGRFVLGGAVFYEYRTGASGETVYRLFEAHEAGRVTRTLHRGTSYDLGNRVDLYSASPSEAGPYVSEENEWVREERSYTLADLEGLQQREETGLDAPTLVRWPNVPGGHSDLKGLSVLMDRFDEAASGGVVKERASHPITFADPSLADGAGRVDLSGVIFSRGGSLMATPLGETPKQYAETVQPDFQEAEQVGWLQWLLTVITLLAGYSPSSWQADSQGGGAESARALRIKLAKTLTTRSGKERMAMDAVGQALAVALAWADGGSEVRKYRAGLEIRFGDGLPVDSAEDAAEAVQWKAADGISTEEVVRMRRPDLDDDGIAEEVKRIEDEEPDPPTPPATPFRPGVGPMDEPEDPNESDEE